MPGKDGTHGRSYRIAREESNKYIRTPRKPSSKQVRGEARKDFPPLVHGGSMPWGCPDLRVL